jgi:hypothetical protein
MVSIWVSGEASWIILRFYGLYGIIIPLIYGIFMGLYGIETY